MAAVAVAVRNKRKQEQLKQQQQDAISRAGSDAGDCREKPSEEPPHPHYGTTESPP